MRDHWVLRKFRALISLCALICASRTLTPAQFGTLTLIHTFAIGVGALTKFQSWQMILKFGARPLELGMKRPHRTRSGLPLRLIWPQVFLAR